MLLLVTTIFATPDPAAISRRAAEHVAAGRWLEAAAAARELEAAAAAKAPLVIADLQLLAAPPEGLGMYRALPDNVARVEEVFIYAQVLNHGLRAVHGTHEIHLVSELVIYDAEGQELARDASFGESRFVARAPQRDTFVVIALRTAGLPSGEYGVELVLHDRIGAKKASRRFKLRVP